MGGAWVPRPCSGCFPLVQLCLGESGSEAKRPAGHQRPETNALGQLVRCWEHNLPL